MGEELVRGKMMKYVLMDAVHVHQVAELEKQCFSDPWSLRSIQSELTNLLSCWVVALCDDKVVGYVGSQTVLGEADMMNLAVSADFRRRGIGSELIRELIEKLKIRGARCLTLEVRASNNPAISLYHKMGFVQIGRRPGYYRNPREDACILRKEWEV